MCWGNLMFFSLFLNHYLNLLLHSMHAYSGVLHTCFIEMKQDSVGLKLTVNLMYFTESGPQSMWLDFVILYVSCRRFVGSQYCFLCYCAGGYLGLVTQCYQISWWYLKFKVFDTLPFLLSLGFWNCVSVKANQKFSQLQEKSSGKKKKQVISEIWVLGRGIDLSQRINETLYS